MENLKLMNAIEAAQYCKKHNVEKNHWGCGYIVEVTLELEHGIKLIEGEWKQLEDILYYNDQD